MTPELMPLSEYAGAGLPRAYEAEFSRLERMFATPAPHEAVTISLNIEAPTILTLGSDTQKQRWVASLRRGDELCCQLFSEPAAGSDLGSISQRAERDGDEWVLNGQKVWTSGAQYADVGYVVARTDPAVFASAGDDGVPRRDGHARCRGPAAASHERWFVVQRGVLHRRACRGLEPCRRCRCRVARDDDDARLRARRRHGRDRRQRPVRSSGAAGPPPRA